MGKRRAVPTPDGHQQCHRCLAMKPLADFTSSRRRANGIEASCRPCLNGRRRERAEVARIVAESIARMDAAAESRSNGAIQPPLERLLPHELETDEYFWRVDAARRRERLQRAR